ncbi:hypothetical protein [Ekhidna sp.]|uniref:hypothetical protein n=1 Tax=Ekhidna sp. TaxID=2608089 RepID=UPI003B510386
MQHSNTKDRKYFLGYLTANDSDFRVDLANLYLMTKKHPGVHKIEMYIVVSELDSHKTNHNALNQMSSLVAGCKWLSLNKIMIKGNIGRDFSSAQLFLSEIENDAKDHDMVMIRNRSAYGPFKKNWYSSYLKLIDSNPHIGLVGTTINFTGSLDRSYLHAVTHVQTYQYLCKWETISDFVTKFPGQNATERLEIIDEGEIGLSYGIMKKGLSIACLNWPNHTFSLENPADENLPKGDIKMDVKSLPFLHRESNPDYPGQVLSVLIKCKILLSRKAPVSIHQTDKFY